jgi:carbamoyl-phosphate synthase large subunit
MIGAVIMKKLFLTDKGKAWAGVTINNEEAKNISKKILDYIKWNSGCELEFIIENKTGKMYLLEINPRFPAWVYLATAAGQNLPEALLKLSLGEKVIHFIRVAPPMKTQILEYKTLITYMYLEVILALMQEE